jgi:putative transcriptional regulator
LAKEQVLLRPGTLLLSEPFLKDPLFGRAVVLLCHHDEDGSFGLILNKPAANPFAEEREHPMSELPFFGGGPVETNCMFFVHRLSYLPEAIPIRDGLYWQGKYEHLLEAVEEGEFQPETGRLFVGYAGWGEGQLEAELEREDWVVYNGSLNNILGENPQDLWQIMLRKTGPYYRMFSSFPPDPSLN